MMMKAGLHIAKEKPTIHRWWTSLFVSFVLVVSSGVLAAEGTDDGRLLVVLDPGHGGKQEGAVSKHGMLEKDLVLDVAQRVRKELDSVDTIRVMLTRNRDQNVSLDERIDLANHFQADVFVSIHANAFIKPSLSGVETFFHSVEASGEEAKRVALFENAVDKKEARGNQDPLKFILEDMHRAEKLRDSSRLAHFIQEELVRRLPFENRGVMQADFVVLGGTRMPSVLIEIGFLTNPKDEKALKTEKVRNQIAQAIREALVKYQRLIRNKDLLESDQKKSAK